MSFARSARMLTRPLGVAARARAGVRNMSGSTPEEIYQNKEMWYKTTIVAAGAIIVPYTLFVLYKESHHHQHEHANFPHMNQRHKEFPWGDCPLFDLECKRAMRAAKAAH